MRCAIGIDPGLSGAIAVLTDVGGRTSLDVWDMPTFQITVGGRQRSRVDLTALHAIVGLAALGADVAAIEDLSGRPSTVLRTGRDGKRERIAQKGLWEQGFNCCAPVMACVAHAVPYHMVGPAVWKARLKVPSDKDGARLMASRLMPEHAGRWPLKKHDGRAEAALLALYALQQI